MKPLRRFGVIPLLAATLAVVAGCSSSGSSSSSSAEASAPASTGASSAAAVPSEPVTITFWHAFNADSAEAATLTDTLIPEFEAQNPGITVEAVAVPYPDLHQKLVTAAAGDQLPDVVRADIIWVPELANLGVLEPLDTLMSDFASISEAVYPGPLDTNKWGDHYYGLPLDTNTRVMLSNASVFEKAGVDIPSTQADVVAAGPAVKEAGSYVFVDNDLSGWNLLPWIWSAGGNITDEAVTTATGYIDSPETIAAVTAIYDLYKAGEIPPILVQGGKDAYEDGVASGKYASMLNGPWAYPIVASKYPDFSLAPSLVPSGSAGSVSVVGGEDIVVTQSSANKDAAAKFVTYMLSDSAQRAMADVGQMSVLKALGPEMTSIQPYYATFVDQLANARPRPPTPAWPEMDTAIKTRLQEAFVGDGDISQALTDLAGQLDEILARYPSS